jgi:ABC-2 type transport system ATP-binding protein
VIRVLIADDHKIVRQGLRFLLSQEPGIEVAVEAADGALEVTGLSTDQVGLAAGKAGITLLELTAQQTSLEEAFMDLTKDAVEYHGSTTTTTSSTGQGALQTTGADR